MIGQYQKAGVYVTGEPTWEIIPSSSYLSAAPFLCEQTLGLEPLLLYFHYRSTCISPPISL